MNEDELPTWKKCRLIIENYEYSTQPGVTGIEYIIEPTPLERFIYENEPLSNKEEEIFMFALLNGLNIGHNNDTTTS